MANKDLDIFGLFSPDDSGDVTPDYLDQLTLGTLSPGHIPKIE